MMAVRWLISLLLLGSLTAAHAQELRRATVWDLKLGEGLSAQPPDREFRGFACGGDGGPPRRPLTGWSDFARCGAEATGLHEVYFEYDDEYEYIARARELPREVARWAGTTEAGFPVIVSALFDEMGVLQAIRMTTDARPEHRNDPIEPDRKRRSEAYLLGAVMAARFGIEAARDCAALPPAEGESAVGSLFVKQSCVRNDPSRSIRIVLRVDYLRRPGESGVNPQMPTQLTHGEFVSSARLEIFHAAGAEPH